MSIYENSEYLEHNQTWHVEDSPWKARQVFRVFSEHKLQAKTVCEIGCGAGEILQQLAPLLPTVESFVGYDISPHLAAMWESRKSQRVKFLHEDFLQSKEHFDVLMFIDIIEHIEDYIGFLRKIKDRGTYKIFHFPLEVFAAKVMLKNRFTRSRAKYGHLHFFNKDICLDVLHDLGFEVVDSFYAPIAMDLASVSTSVSLSSRLLKLPRVLLSAISTDLAARTLGGYSLFILAK